MSANLKDLNKLAKRTVNLETLIPNFKGTIRSMAIRVDEKTDAEVLMMRCDVEMPDGIRELTQKLKGMHIATLLDENFTKMKIKSMADLIDQRFVFTKTTFRIGFPRWLPVKRA